MILEDLMNVLRSRNNVLIIKNNYERSMPKECRLVAVPDFIRIDDYLSDELLAATVTRMDIDKVPAQIYISFEDN